MREYAPGLWVWPGLPGSIGAYDQVVVWVGSAALAGAIGGAAYDGLRAVVRRLFRRGQAEDAVILETDQAAEIALIVLRAALPVLDRAELEVADLVDSQFMVESAAESATSWQRGWVVRFATESGQIVEVILPDGGSDTGCASIRRLK